MNKKKLKKALNKRAEAVKDYKPVDKKTELDNQFREINQNLNQNTLDIIYAEKWYTYQHLPYGDGGSGVYIIKFPNNKRYVGSSNHVIKRLKTHMSHLENGSCHLWYDQAAKENGLLCTQDVKEQLAQIRSEYNLDFTPPPHDPRDDEDKSGHRIGNRVSKKKLAQYKEEYAKWEKLRAKEEEEAHYSEYLGRCARVQAEFDDTWKRRQKNIDKMIINVCYCDDYRGYESLILSSIPEEEQCYWYNSIFK